MRISETGAERGSTLPWRSAEHGFTLVELLVVLAIIGMAGAAVALAIPDPRGDLRIDGERFAARVHAVQDAAVIEARDMALWVSESGYGFERREAGRWRRIDERPFREQAWSEGARALVGPVARARIRFDATGQAEPLDVTLMRDDGRITIRIAADGTIHVG